jgi:hypothetical protein
MFVFDQFLFQILKKKMAGSSNEIKNLSAPLGPGVASK